MNLLFQAAQQARLIRERQELIFWTTAGPTTTFDPKITGVDGVWFFDDGTTIAAASGATISKTFAAEGLHMAVFRPASGGLSAVTQVDCGDDKITSFKNLKKCSSLWKFITNYNTFQSFSLWDLSRSVTYLNIASILDASATITGGLAALPPILTYFNMNSTPRIAGTLAELPSTLQTCYINSTSLITASSIAHLTSIADLRIHNMGWLTADVDTVIDSMWAARANYTYATGPSLQIGGTNQAPTGNVIAPIEGADWHQGGATWIPLTAGAKIYDLANNVNSEVRPSWAITYTA